MEECQHEPDISSEIPVCIEHHLGPRCASCQAALVTNVLGSYDWYTDSANFTVLSPNGGVVGSGANNVGMTWDGNAYSASSEYTGPGSASNVTLSTTAPFFGHMWAAHDIQMFTPGSYSLGTGSFCRLLQASHRLSIWKKLRNSGTVYIVNRDRAYMHLKTPVE